MQFLEKNHHGKTTYRKCIAKIIEENWKTVERFANSEDMTTRVAGMKFPKEGWSKNNQKQ